MSLLALVEGKRVRATVTGQRAVCASGECGARMDAVISDLYTPHWRHFANQCTDEDKWQIGKETEWHLKWKDDSFRLGAHVEEPMEHAEEKHRADIVTPEGRVVEVQHSSITVKTVAKRQSFYPRVSGHEMVWIFDARQWGIRRRVYSGNVVFFKWLTRPPAACELPEILFLDLGDAVLEVRGNNSSSGARIDWHQYIKYGPLRPGVPMVDRPDPKLGWGILHTRAEVLAMIAAEEWPGATCGLCGSAFCLSPFQQLDQQGKAEAIDERIEEVQAEARRIAAIERERAELTVDEAHASGLAIQIAGCHDEAKQEEVVRQQDAYIKGWAREREKQREAQRQAENAKAAERRTNIERDRAELTIEEAHAAALEVEMLICHDEGLKLWAPAIRQENLAEQNRRRMIRLINEWESKHKRTFPREHTEWLVRVSA